MLHSEVHNPGSLVRVLCRTPTAARRAAWAVVAVTGSLATLLWLLALRREGIGYGALAFLKVGIVVTLPALALALLTLTL